MPTKATMFFSALIGGRAFGWTESHFKQSTSLPGVLTDLFILAETRSRLLGAGVEMPYLRVSATEVFRDSQVMDGPVAQFTLTGNPPTVVFYNPITAPGPQVPLYDDTIFPLITPGDKTDIRCDFPYSALLLRMEANPQGSLWTSRASLSLRGSPDVVQYTLRANPQANVNPASAQWLHLLNAYKTVLTTGGWGFMAIDPGAPQKSITAFAWANNVMTLTSAAHGYSEGQIIRISGTELILPGVGSKSKALNGVFTVGATTSGTFTLIEPFPDYTGWIFSKIGYARSRSKVFAEYTHEVNRRWMERKTGGPFDRPIGRRRRRQSQCA